MLYHSPVNRLFAVAPMLAYTNRHARYLYRLLCPHALLFTEMIHAMAVLSRKRHRHLAFSEQEHPVAVQLAGNDPQQLAQAALVCEDYGYEEINLNIGCPSNKVRQGEFGACLMSKPQQVAELVRAISDRVSIPVSIKCRLGIDQQDYRQTLPKFIEITHQAGCSFYTLHARMAWLRGINPKQNRDLPPLDYDYVYEIKRQFPQLHITINGGIDSVEQCLAHLEQVDGVMLGRAVLSRPAILTSIEQRMFGGDDVDIIDLVRHQYAVYADQQLRQDANVAILIRPLFPLFAGLPGGGMFRRRLANRTDLWSDMTRALDHALEAVESYANEYQSGRADAQLLL